MQTNLKFIKDKYQDYLQQQHSNKEHSQLMSPQPYRKKQLPSYNKDDPLNFIDNLYEKVFSDSKHPFASKRVQSSQPPTKKKEIDKENRYDL